MDDRDKKNGRNREEMVGSQEDDGGFEYAENDFEEEMKPKEKQIKNFKANVWLSEDFPIKINDFVPLLQVLGLASKHISKFKDFIVE
jgi:hypothetical protein